MRPLRFERRGLYQKLRTCNYMSLISGFVGYSLVIQRTLVDPIYDELDLWWR